MTAQRRIFRKGSKMSNTPQTGYKPSSDMNATVIPSARTQAGADTDGRSLGFDPEAPPTRLLIDPGHPTGALEVNLADLVKNKELFNKKATQTNPTQDVKGFYETLKQVPVSEDQPVSVDPLLIQQLIEEENVQTQLQQVVTLRAQTDAFMSQTPGSQLSKSEIPRMPLLDIPFLTGAPVKPEYQVFFDLGNMGILSANYHAAIVGNNCLCLVYDTRFEYGVQYLPPSLTHNFKLTIPKISKTPFICSSHKLHWDMGKLSFVLLLIHEEL